MVNMRDCGEIPGTAGQRACLESVVVVNEVADDHFHDFVREPAGRFVRDVNLWRRVTEQAIDLGFSPSPDDHHAIRNVCPCGRIVQKLEPFATWIGGKSILDVERVGALEEPTSLVVGDIVIVAVGVSMCRTDRIGSAQSRLI